MTTRIMCNHLWIHRNGRDECLRCDETASDGRGLPRGHYAINGEAKSLSKLRMSYACPVCLAPINPRVVLGELRVLCAGPGVHDIAALGKAMPKARADYLRARQEVDAVDVLYGMRKRGEKIMPILDLQQDAAPRLKRAGIIRLGIKKKNARGVEYPSATEYFVLKDAPGVEAICKTDKPTRLNVMFPFNEIERNFPAWHQLWRAGGLVCRGNGERVEYAINPETGEALVKGGRARITGDQCGMNLKSGHPVKCPGMEHDLYPRCLKCRPGAMLIVMMREMPRLAYYQISTGSIHNIIKLTGQMRYLLEWLGKLEGVPFILELRPEKISTPSGPNGKRARRVKHLLNLEVDPAWVEEMFKVMRARSLPGAPAPLALPEPHEPDTPPVSAATWSVEGLDDEPEWEAIEHYNGDAEINDAESQEESAPELPAVTDEQIKAALLLESPGKTPFYQLAGDDLRRVDKAVWSKFTNAQIAGAQLILRSDLSDQVATIRARLMMDGDANKEASKEADLHAAGESGDLPAGPSDADIPPEALMGY